MSSGVAWGDEIVEPGLGGDHAGGGRVVAGDHHRANAHGAQLRGPFADPRLEHVGQIDDAQDPSVDGHRQGRRALLADALGDALEVGGNLAAVAVLDVADQGIHRPLAHHAAVGEVRTAHAGLRREVHAHGFFQSVFFMDTQGFGIGAGGLAFRGAVEQRGEVGRLLQLLARDTLDRQELGGLAVADGDGAGLVQQQGVDVAGGFHGLAGHRQHIEAQRAVDTGNTDGREQGADGGGDQRDDQRHQVGDVDLRVEVTATGAMAVTTMTKISVSTESSTVRAISFGVFCRLAPSTRLIMRSRKVLPGEAVTRITSESEITLVPPVTVELTSEPDSLITGADSPVIIDSST